MNATTRTYASHRNCTHAATPQGRKACRATAALLLELRARLVTVTPDAAIYVLPRPVGRPRRNATRDYLIVTPDARVFRAAA